MSRNLQSIAPTIAQYPSYDELLANSEQVPLSEFQSLNANEMPRFADGLFDLPPGPGLRRKRKRLSDFSEKEKQARRKLKNRIAAQSARDRKRFEADQNMKNMGELEAEVKRLRAENRELRQENSQLREDNHGLRQDNMILRQENGNTRTSSPKMRRFNENFHGQNSGYSSWNSAHSSPNTSPNNSYVNINSISGNTNKSVANNNVIVDPHAVERTLSNNSVVPTSSNQLLQVVGPADASGTNSYCHSGEFLQYGSDHGQRYNRINQQHQENYFCKTEATAKVRTNSGFVYASDDGPFSDSRYYDGQNGQIQQQQPIQFERVKQTFEGSSESERENQTSPSFSKSDNVLGDSKSLQKRHSSGDSQKSSKASSKPTKAVLSPETIQPSLSRQVSDEAFLDDILKNISKDGNGNDSEFFDDVIGQAEILEWWSGPDDKELPDTCGKNAELSGVSVQKSSENGPGVSSENKHIGSHAETSHPSSPKETKDAKSSANLGQHHKNSNNNQHKTLPPLHNYSSGTHGSRPIARCSPIIIQHNDPPCQMSSPPIKDEKSTSSTKSQPHGPPQNLQTSSTVNSKVQVVQLVQSTCGQAYFVVQN